MRNACILLTFFFVSILDAKQSICLNMIIKNESAVIERCLESVKPLITHWVIVDTGSTDDTQEIVRNYMKDIPGELHERPWKNFAFNRNEALNLAKPKADYILFIDADEVFVYDASFRFPNLDKDCYYFTTEFCGLSYARAQLIKSSIFSEWKGALHEVLYFNEPITRETLADIFNLVRTDGARSQDPLKYEKDALVLEEELKEKPDDHRTVFYLAQSYRDAGNHKKALENYKRRVALGGWDEEIYWSLLQIAHLEEKLQSPSETIVQSYYTAFQHRATRAEPLYYLAQHYRHKKDYAAAYSKSTLGLMIPHSDDILFVEKWIYDYGLLLEKSIAAYWLGKYEEAKNLSLQILKREIPAYVRTCVERNLAFTEGKLNN